MVTQDFPQNPGKSWATYHRLGGRPILNPNRGRLCPILGIVSGPPPETLNFTLNMSNPQPRLASEIGAILETRRLPRIFLKIQGNHGRPITVRGAPILNPNRGKVCPVLRIVSSPLAEALNCTLNMSNPQPRLASKNGAISEAQWFPRIFLKIRGDHGKPITVWGGPF